MIRRDVSIAALRAIEAVRLHAAHNGGMLPTSLDEIAIVPVPNHPRFGESIPYRVEGKTATLEVRLNSERSEPFDDVDQIFEIAIRRPAAQGAPKQNE
jgi:hypothetical protein